MTHHVHPLILAVWRLTQQLELLDEGLHIDERVVISLQDKADIEVCHSVLHDKVCLVQYAFVVGLFLHRVAMLSETLSALYLHPCRRLKLVWLVMRRCMAGLSKAMAIGMYRSALCCFAQASIWNL